MRKLSLKLKNETDLARHERLERQLDKFDPRFLQRIRSWEYFKGREQGWSDCLKEPN